jgi:hypothetical protein
MLLMQQVIEFYVTVFVCLISNSTQPSFFGFLSILLYKCECVHASIEGSGGKRILFIIDVFIFDSFLLVLPRSMRSVRKYKNIWDQCDFCFSLLFIGKHRARFYFYSALVLHRMLKFFRFNIKYTLSFI